jgi:site-specific DNA-methyltransferase (adenine-specific)
MQAWHEQWAREVLRVVKPGAYGVVFGGTRTYHRLACALEDVGWELRDCLAWIYGQGFPKSLDVAKAVAKQQPSAATEWEGWGTSLKPAWEPILLIRKPLIGTVAKNVLRHHTGALNIDGCRITTDETLVRRLGKTTTSASGWTSANRSEIAGKDGGRWPANLVLDEESAALLDTQVGGVSRFFYCTKATKKERDAGLGDQSNNHPTVKPVALMRWLARLVTPPGGVVLDPFTGSGTTGVACAYEELSFLGVEMNAEYVELAQQRVVAAASPTQR